MFGGCSCGRGVRYPAWLSGKLHMMLRKGEVHGSGRENIAVMSSMWVPSPAEDSV